MSVMLCVFVATALPKRKKKQTLDPSLKDARDNWILLVLFE